MFKEILEQMTAQDIFEPLLQSILLIFIGLCIKPVRLIFSNDNKLTPKEIKEKPMAKQHLLVFSLSAIANLMGHLRIFHLENYISPSFAFFCIICIVCLSVIYMYRGYKKPFSNDKTLHKEQMINWGCLLFCSLLFIS